MSIDKKKFRIRKLTPTECLRLMSVPDEDIQKVKDIGMSDSQMYKQAGNSLVSNCVELIFEHLFKAQYQEDFKCYDENFQ
jgi:DNA (cytosine-5)-methyltransferase 1